MSHAAMRRCAYCGKVREKRELYRFYLSSESCILLDKRQNAEGRGAYLCKDENCLRQAEKKRSIQRSLKLKQGKVMEIPEIIRPCGQESIGRGQAFSME